MDSKFEKLAESTMVRFQQGGILVGDIVRFKKDAVNNPKLKNITNQMAETIKQLAETDLNLRVSAIKSIRPSTGAVNDGLGNSSTSAPTDFWIDVVVEHNPGSYSNPVTVPIEVVEPVDTHGNLAPIPDSLKRPNNVNIKPQEVEVELTVKNTKIAYSGGPVTEDTDEIGDLYSEMKSRKINSLTVCIPTIFSENVEKYLTTEGYNINNSYLDGTRVTFEVDTDKKDAELRKELQENCLGQFAYVVIKDANLTV